MSKPVIITAESSCDLSTDLKRRYSIRTIPLTITLDNVSFPDDGNFTPADMYRRYRSEGTLPTTAAPSPAAYHDFFAQIRSDGYEIVHLSISAELSSSYQSALLAARDMKGVFVVDTRMLSTGIGLLAIEGAECAARGIGAAEIAGHLMELRQKVQTSFVLNTLDYMRAGGRCSGVAAFGTNLLKIKPALTMQEGKLTVYKKYRGDIRQVYRKYITERLRDRKIRPDHVFLTESGDIPPVLVDELVELVGNLTRAKEIHHTRAGCTISSHCGPKTLGVLFLNE